MNNSIMWRYIRSNCMPQVTRDTSSVSLTLTVAAVAFMATSNVPGINTNRKESNSQMLDSDIDGKTAKDNPDIFNPKRYIHDLKVKAQNLQRQVAACESPKPPSGSKSVDITFRRRRLSINDQNPAASRKDENQQTGRGGITKPSEIQKGHIMYSAEFENVDSLLKIADQDSSAPQPPFPSHQVGTFSCHGIEPQPHIIYDTPEHDSDVKSFLRNMFGAKSPLEKNRARIVTVTKQKINQDRGHIIYPYDSDQQTALFGAYDGHGLKGELLAEYTMNALCDKLHLHPDFTGKKPNMEKAFKQVFTEIDAEVGDLENLAPLHSGSTACVVLLQGKKLWVSNIGDSRAVLGRRRGVKNVSSLEAIDLTIDQTVHMKEERDRVLKSGGYITIPQNEDLPARIWLDEKCSQIGLAMSRSIGDHALSHVGVIAEPEVKDYVLSDHDEFFIIATDGVWEFLTSSEAVEIVGKCLQQGLGANDACKELIKVAMNKWKVEEGDYRDDITAIVVRLGGIWDHS